MIKIRQKVEVKCEQTIDEIKNKGKKSIRYKKDMANEKDERKVQISKKVNG